MLALDEEDLSACVSCGLCLPHCPTFRVSGEESLSPRGRIDAMRGVVREGAPIDDQFVEFMETCVQCRGCEPACPSDVPFGSLMAATRAELASTGRVTPRWQRLAFAALARHRLLLVGSTALAVAQRLRLVPPRLGRRLGIGPLPLRRPAPLTSTGDDVWILTGCVMDAWQRGTHRSTAALVAATGATYRVPGAGASCCGALHVHAGLRDEARDLARRVMGAMPGDAPILVDSAGCGAAMEEYGELVGGDEARRFAERVVDVSEWLAERVDLLPEPAGERPVVIVQDPCHLRHVQRAEAGVRTLLGRVADVVELDDDGVCCGAGGAYSALQPELAGAIRDRKLEAVDRALERSSATVLASANPGCSMHLAAAAAERGLRVVHPVDLVAEALGLDAP